MGENSENVRFGNFQNFLWPRCDTCYTIFKGLVSEIVICYHHPFIGKGPSGFYLEVIREDWAGVGRGVGNGLRLVDVHNVLRVDLKKDYTSGLDFRLKSVDMMVLKHNC